MSKLSFRARALDASKPMPIYLAEELPDLPDYSAINRAVPQMPSGMEKEEESEHHLQRAISGSGLIIPTPEVCEVGDLEFYARCYPGDYKMPKQHIHMQPLWEEQEAPEYDMDTEDERWLKQQRHPDLTELLFEQMMDKLERCSGQTVVTLNEAKLLLERKDDLVIAVYDYWLNKRLSTQHALILSVKTESRPGQSTNNPYLAFRRRTEKMQTRKNRKNDESSYEKMLKLRRDLVRALSLLQMVARREEAKRDIVKLTAHIADHRYVAKDFANQLLPEPPPRPVYTAVTIPATNYRREQYTVQHYPPRAPPTPVDQPRQREKRPYKRRKHRHHAVGSTLGLRDTGVYTSSEEEVSPRAEPASPPDDGPFAFRRKTGCYYEMPTSTLRGDRVEGDDPATEGLFQHEVDLRHRFNLTSLNCPYPHCVGFARRRYGRGGRLLLDRVRTPLDDLWTRIDFNPPAGSRYQRQRDEEVELETKVHRTPKEMTRDYHTSGKHPWRHAFRRHLARNPHLWIADVKHDDLKLDLGDVKVDVNDVKVDVDDVKIDVDDVKIDFDVKMDVDKIDLPQDSDISVRTIVSDNEVEVSDITSDFDRATSGTDRGTSPIPSSSRATDHTVHGIDSNSGVDGGTKGYSITGGTQTTREYVYHRDDRIEDRDWLRLDSAVRSNIDRVARKRALSGCSCSSYDSDESLHPVEKEFEQFITEVNTKWLHFRPKTPPPSSPPTDDDLQPLSLDTPISVELWPGEGEPSGCLDSFVTSQFTLGELYGDVARDVDNSTSSLEMINDDLLSENFTGLTEAQVESILSDTDLKSLDVDLKDKKIAEDILEELVKDVEVKDCGPFLSYGQGACGRAGPGRRKADVYGSSTVRVVASPEPVLVDKVEVLVKEERMPTPPPKVETPVKEITVVKQVKREPSPVPTSSIIVEEVNEVTQVKVERKKVPECNTLEEVQLAHGVQLKTVQTKHSPLKKHIITSAAHRRAGDVAAAACPEPAQLVTVAVSDSLKVRLQNHLLSSQAGGSGATVVGLVQNGPFAGAGGVAVVQSREPGVSGVSVSSTSSPRRVSAPLVHLAPSLTHKQLHLHPHQSTPVVVAQSHTLHHVAPNKLKVLHAHPLTQSQRTQLLAQNRSIAQLPAVVSLATLGEAKTTNAALLKTAPGSVTQFFEIKGGQLGKGPHLVNVVRQPQPGKTTVARLDLNDAKKRQVVATFDGTLKGNIQAVARPHRVNLNLDGRQIVRAAMPAVRAPHNIRHQIQLKNRTFQVAQPIARTSTDPSTSITVSAAPKTASIPSSVVANLLQKNVQLPKGGQKIAISGPGGQPLSANVQAIAFTTAQLKARQARLITQPRAQPVAEIVEATTAPVATSSTSSETPMEVTDANDSSTNGAVRRRTAENLPMEVT